MSFGKLFLPPGTESLKPHIGIIYDELVEKEIRESIQPPDPELHHLSRSLGRLFDTGVNSDQVEAHLKRIRKEKKQIRQEPSQFPNQINDTNRQKFVSSARPKNIMNVTTALQKKETLEGGKFHIPSIPLNYEERFTVCF
jgi:hypothetical protein